MCSWTLCMTFNIQIPKDWYVEIYCLELNFCHLKLVKSSWVWKLLLFIGSAMAFKHSFWNILKRQYAINTYWKSGWWKDTVSVTITEFRLRGCIANSALYEHSCELSKLLEYWFYTVCYKKGISHNILRSNVYSFAI